MAVLKKGDPAPSFRVVSTTGEELQLANYRGQVLIVDFFASWCTPCSDASAHLVKLNRKFGKKGLKVVGLSLDDEVDKPLKEFIIANRIDYPVALAGTQISKDFSIRSVPSVYLINKKGVVEEKFTGFNDSIAGRLEKLVQKLIAE
jgi:peroxiredoxin